MQASITTTCENCNNPTPASVLQASFTELGHCLCRSCLANLKMKMEQSTWEAIQLYLNLKEKGVAASIQSQVQYEVPPTEVEAPVITINVDSRPSNTTLADLSETARYQAIRKGFLTVRISSELISTGDGETAAYINRFLNRSRKSL